MGIYMIASNVFFMFKEHEHYQQQVMNVYETAMAMEDQEAGMQMIYDEFLGWVQFWGNWDYVATKLNTEVTAVISNMQEQKCGKTVAEHAADYGYYLTPAGEVYYLQQYDMKIQFMEFLMANNMTGFEYMCMKMKQMMPMMESEEDDQMSIMPVMPEFVFVPSQDVDYMNLRIENI